MTTKTTKTEPKERAAISKERRLALTLRAVLDAWKDIDPPDTATENSKAAIEEAEMSANELLNELGYSTLESIPSAIKRLTAELAAVTEAGDWKRVSEIGQQLDRAKAGLPPVKVKVAAE